MNVSFVSKTRYILSLIFLQIKIELKHVTAGECLFRSPHLPLAISWYIQSNTCVVIKIIRITSSGEHKEFTAHPVSGKNIFPV